MGEFPRYLLAVLWAFTALLISSSAYHSPKTIDKRSTSRPTRHRSSLIRRRRLDWIGHVHIPGTVLYSLIFTVWVNCWCPSIVPSSSSLCKWASQAQQHFLSSYPACSNDYQEESSYHISLSKPFYLRTLKIDAFLNDLSCHLVSHERYYALIPQLVALAFIGRNL